MLKQLAVAIRTLSKRPGYSLAVILTLALGIGTTTLTFSVADAALLRPLPFREPDRLVFLMGVAGPQRSPRGGSMPEVGDWRAMNRTLLDVSLYDNTSLNMRVGSDVVRVQAELVNAGFFEILGAQAAMGRTFRPDEDQAPGRDAVAVISDALWRERFGADSEILRRTVQLNDRAFTVVGVMPPGFSGLSFDTDVWIPSMSTATPTLAASRGSRWLGSVGRLRDEVTIGQAQEDLSRVAAILEQQHPQYNRQRGVDVTWLRDTLLGDAQETLVAISGAVLLFLLIACANVAGLQLARATARRRELAVRLALGARRRHVLAQLLTESLALALAAGTIGTLAAAWALGGLVALTPDGALPRHVVPALNPRAVAFALFVSAGAAVLVSILPALAAMRRDVVDAMKEGARSAGPGLGSIRRPSTQQALVIAEIALAMTLLSAAGLMVRSLERQLTVRLGFEAEGMTVARVTLPATRYTAPQRAALAERLLEQLRDTPGVTGVAVSTSLPFTGNVSASVMIPEGAVDGDAGIRYFRNAVTPDFFTTLGIPIERGRAFSSQDQADTPAVAIVNASGARRLWGTVDAVGRRFRLGLPTGVLVEVVGVAADARFRNLTTDFTTPRLEPDIYFPFAQRPEPNLEFALRTRDGAAVPPGVLQAAVSSFDAGLPVYAVQRLPDAVRRETSTARFASALLTIFSTGALLLAAVGLYGLIAYIVGLSRREIGIRLALGADTRRVALLIVRNGLMLTGMGIVLGIAGAAAAGRAIEAQLFQTPPLDVPTLAAVTGLLVVVAAAASAIPTRRAVRVDPQSALRSE